MKENKRQMDVLRKQVRPLEGSMKNFQLIVMALLVIGLVSCERSTVMVKTQTPTVVVPSRVEKPSIAPSESTATRALQSESETPTFRDETGEKTVTAPLPMDPMSTKPTLPAPPILPALNGVIDSKCPAIKSDLKLSFPDLVMEGVAFNIVEYPIPNAILGALNQGASITAIREAIDNITTDIVWDARKEKLKYRLSTQDLTGDGVPEILFFSRDRNLIYTCRSGKYHLVFDQYLFDIPVQMIDPIIRDLNRDGLPEITIGYNNGNSVVGGLAVAILGWKENRFKNLITSAATEPQWDTILDQSLEGYYYVSGYASVEVSDINGDGLDEIVLPAVQGNLDVLFHGPFRKRTDILGWNGQEFAPLMPRYDPPTYRFQAVEDGDRAFQAKDYNLALKFYRQAIEDPKLEWWSEERYIHMQAEMQAKVGQQPSPTPLPPDSSEYPRLAGYANYRMVLAYLAQGQLPYAEQAYRDFQAGFPKGKLGHVYAEMGKIFWDTYQSTGSLGEGCNQANSYINEHYDEILGVLDFIWHGWQSIEYQPTIVCPFQ